MISILVRMRLSVGAMTGAIAGAHHGYEKIPSRWLDKLENGAKGRDYVIHLAKDLYETLLRMR